VDVNRRPWQGSSLTVEQRAVLDVAGSVVGHIESRTDGRGIEGCRALAEQGLWAMSAEPSGHDPESESLALAVKAGIASAWPAVAVAAVYADAAVSILAADDAGGLLLGKVRQGAPVAIVDAQSLAAESVDIDGTRIVRVPRVDVCVASPDVVLLLDRTTAVVIPAAEVRFGPILSRTGMDGACTVPAEISLDAPTARITSVGVEAARIMVYRGLTAVAAGLAESVVQQAWRYVATRVQFGAPLLALPTVRDLMNNMTARAHGMLAVSLAAPADAVCAATTLETAVAQAVDMAADGLQAHGGYGYLVEYGAESLLRDAVSLQAAAHAVVIDRQVMDPTPVA
jgi:alkylation response protein AidB-like acyl-CoA dehydrogenase